MAPRWIDVASKMSNAAPISPMRPDPMYNPYPTQEDIIASTSMMNQYRQPAQMPVGAAANLNTAGTTDLPNRAVPTTSQYDNLQKQIEQHFAAVQKRRQEVAKGLQDKSKAVTGSFKPQHDLSPLLSYIDAKTGTNYASQYQRPETAENRIGMADTFARQARATEEKAAQDDLSLLKSKLAFEDRKQKTTDKREFMQLGKDQKQLSKYGMMRRGLGRGGALIKEFEKRDLAIRTLDNTIKGMLNGTVDRTTQNLKDLSAEFSKAKSGSAPQLSIIEATDYQTAQRTVADMWQYVTANPKSAISDELLNSISKSLDALKLGVNDKYNELQADIYNTQVKANKFDEKYPEAMEAHQLFLDKHVEYDEKGRAHPKGYLDRAKKPDKEVIEEYAGQKYRFTGGDRSKQENWEIVK